MQSSEICACKKAARASLASTVSELVDTLPKMAVCHSSKFFQSNGTRVNDIASMLTSKANAHYLFSSHSPPADIDSKNGVPTKAVTALLKEARHIVIAARSALS